jgi:hypothetical protein
VIGGHVHFTRPQWEPPHRCSAADGYANCKM